ncbi:MAG TPA: alanine racemase [Acidobacteriota bacterium]|nr:alanine racemase [Acidobacteriota bacterium]
MGRELLSKGFRRLDGYVRRAGFDLFDRSLKDLTAGLYFTKYPGTQHFAAEEIRDPSLKKLASGLDCLKVAADACYRALGWQKETSLQALLARGIEIQGHIEGVGWIHTKVAELAREQSVESFCREGLSINQLCRKLLEDRLVLASVNPGFQQGEDKKPRGGHFVIVYGFEWDGGKCAGFYVYDMLNSAGGEGFVSADAFRRAFSGRAIFVSVPWRAGEIRTQPLAWVEVDLTAICHNVAQLKNFVGRDVAIAAVVKANAYGHGAAQVARVLLENGAKMLAVATIDEAVCLRESGIRAPVLVLYGAPIWEAARIVEYDLETAVFDEDLPRALAAAARKHRKRISVHLSVDTGMGWYGLSFEEPRIVSLAKELQELPQLFLKGLFSHFANSSDDPAYTQMQLERFLGVVRRLEGEGIVIPFKHVSNSAAILRCPEAMFNMVRPGLVLYGLDPMGGGTDRNRIELRPALQFKTRIIQVRSLSRGEAIGYGSTYVVSRQTTIAILPVGYFDGIPRAISREGCVLVRGQRARIAGTICMNMMVIDVTDIPGVKRGDEAVLLGRQGSLCIGAEDIARAVGTISYEIVTRIAAHIPRVFTPSGECSAPC